jgi:hypothetical protein
VIGDLHSHLSGPAAIETVCHFFPVDHVPKRGQVIRLHVGVLKVIRVFPHINNRQWNTALADVALMVVDLLCEEALTNRVPCEGTPTRTLDSRSGFGQL